MDPVQEFNSEMESLVVKELELNGVNLKKQSWLSKPAVIQELLRIIVSPAHEGRVASTGVIFAQDVSELLGAELISIPFGHTELLRKLANGVDYFLLYEKDEVFGLAHFKEPMITELQLLRCFPASGGMLVQRGPTGITKFFQGEHVILHENRIWLVKPHIKEAEWRISQCFSSIDRRTLRGILEVAFHLISPATRVGATFVWCLQPPSPELLKVMMDGENLNFLNLFIQDEARSTAICHLLSQVDGATFIDPGGRLIYTEVQLKYSEKSRDLIPEFKGTRHTSAQRFSFDHDETLVVTISEDGPVNVFLGGANIAALKIHSTFREMRLLVASTSETQAEVNNHSFEIRCSRCGKNSRIDQINVSGLVEEKQVFCPVCRAPLYRAVCFSMDCRPYRDNSAPAA